MIFSARDKPVAVASFDTILEKPVGLTIFGRTILAT